MTVTHTATTDGPLTETPHPRLTARVRQAGRCLSGTVQARSGFNGQPVLPGHSGSTPALNRAEAFAGGAYTTRARSARTSRSRPGRALGHPVATSCQKSGRLATLVGIGWGLAMFSELGRERRLAVFSELGGDCAILIGLYRSAEF